ncbi:MAG: repeat protein [Candidatus Acidoferrum typicum]|nr:repeat protein [Candidatus Acidoferrum typicum]
MPSARGSSSNYTGCLQESGFNFTGSVNTKNQIAASGYAYDAAGNLIAAPPTGTTYTYDAENHLVSTGGVTYTYDGDGRRVTKSNGTIYSYLPSGDVLMESALSNGYEQFFYFFFNGKRVGNYNNLNAACEVAWYFTDPLGSTRFYWQWDGDGGWNRSDYYPFGGERVIQSDETSHFKFTGKERDTESGNDYFGARYFGSSMGRFMSPDPVVITTERLQNPQQLNLYAYVANNPLRYIDPTGEILQSAGDRDSQKQCFADLQQIAGDAANRLSMDAVGSKNTYDFSVGPTVMTDKGLVKIDYIIANLPTFGDQPKGGNPPAGVSDIVGLYFNNPNVTRGSNTNLKVSPEWTVAFHELAEAYEKIDGGNGGSYAGGHNAALQREMRLRDQRPYLKEYNTGAGGPANSPNPQGKIIIKK